MTLFSIAKKNIARNFSQYFLYIASMVFSIVIYFTFVTLKYSDTIEREIESSQKIGSLMSGAAFVLIFFVAIFIFYCNAFFMKKRKKEVALYALLGVRKRQIGFMLFFENLLLGAVSLLAGIIIGFLASKGLLSILIRLMGYDVAAPFAFSWQAVMNTVIIFMIIFLVTSLQGYRVIYQFKLIDLFHASAKGEAVTKPNPVIAAIGVFLVGLGYFLALQDMTSKIWQVLGFLVTPMVILFATIIGTYLLFHSFTGTMLKWLKKSEKWLWRDLRVLTISQLLHRVKAHATTLTLIAILSATTITAGGAVFGLYYNISSTVKQMDPNTYMFVEQDEATMKKINRIVGDTDYNRVVETIEQNFMYNGEKMAYTLLSESEYNRLANVQQRDEIHVKGHQFYALDAAYDERFSPSYTNMTLQTKQEDFKVIDYKPYNVLNSALAYSTMVVSDDVYDTFAAKKSAKLQHFRVVIDPDATKADAKKVATVLPEDAQLSSQPADMQANVESMGVLLFIGSFLGLVFLAATGSIIYFKMLTEAEEDKAKYVMLHKMGVSMKAMRRSIAGQNVVIFFVPLLIGILHSAVALKAFSSLLSMNLIIPVCMWMLAYTMIYALFYILTVWSYTKMIKQTIQTEGV